MINSRLRNALPNSRSGLSSINVRNTKASATQGSGTSNGGYPIGLLLALTYAGNAVVAGGSSDYKPNVRIY